VDPDEIDVSVTIRRDLLSQANYWIPF